jgi:hypothetical protein
MTVVFMTGANTRMTRRVVERASEAAERWPIVLHGLALALFAGDGQCRRPGRAIRLPCQQIKVPRLSLAAICRGRRWIAAERLPAG